MSMNNMAARLVEMTKGFSEMDFSDMPGTIFMGLLRRRLIEKGFSVADAEMVAARMEVGLPPGSMTQEQLEEVATNYAIVLDKIRAALADQGFENPMIALREAASKMSLTLST